MKKENCFYLGRVIKPFGYKGELNLFFDVDDPEKYAKLDVLFVEIKGQLIPYFIEKIQIRERQTVVKFKDLTVEQANAIVGCELYLPLEALPKLEGNKFYFHEVVGFKIIDEEKGDIGILETTIDNGPQPIFQIINTDKEILIPVIDDFIIEVNRDEKYIRIKAPEGLIDFYIG